MNMQRIVELTWLGRGFFLMQLQRGTIGKREEPDRNVSKNLFKDDEKEVEIKCIWERYIENI